METATACVLDGTNETFWFAQKTDGVRIGNKKGLQAETPHIIAVRGRSWSNFRNACNLSFLFDVK